MKASVIGSSGGIGRALDDCLRAETQFDTVETLSRSEHGFNICDEASIARGAQEMQVKCSALDLITNATGTLGINCNRLRRQLKRSAPTR